ncbi:MAG: molybdenum cofactor biosynthesis protein MoaE [Fimbriimonadales bacterium]
MTREAIDPEAVRASIEDATLGGVVLFLGEVRGTTGGRATSKLFYEAYEEMALPHMRAIALEAEGRWGARVAMVHRLGELLPGKIAVATAAACAHRAEAFDCCRFLIDRLKEDVPIWKKEFGDTGNLWVE